MSTHPPPVVPSKLPDLDACLPQLAASFAATAARHDREASFPFENFRALHRAGLLGLAAPARFGGCAADLATSQRVVSAISRGEPSTGLILAMQYLVHTMIEESSSWPEHLKQRVIGDAIENGALINSLRVEPELGTPARGGLPATVARRTAQNWRLNGRKIYSTGAPALTWMVVWARTDDAEPLVGGWLVHRDTPGIRIEETWDHAGMRASGSHDVIFEDVEVPRDHALSPQPHTARLPYAAQSMLWNVVLVSAVYDGVARAARDWLVGWLIARSPSNLGASLSTLPRFQEAVGTIDQLLLANTALLRAAARGEIEPAEIGLVKTAVTENAIRAVDKALEVTGNPGLSRHNPLERHHRDVLCGRIHTPQADSALIGAGRAAFADHQTTHH